MAETVVFKIDIEGNAYEGMLKIEKQAEKTTEKTKKFHDAMAKLSNIGIVMRFISSTWDKISNSVAACEEAYKSQSIAESKLTQVMRNTIGAGNDEIKSILDLASAQQKIGVISAGAQTAGAQELATYLEKTESLKKLIPAINDTVAQQYGLNASQEQYTGIATMFGKVMQGQVGALSRYGYTFDKAQEKILKFGNEEQRAAMLAEVIRQSVGGVNEALARTPEGKLQQQVNSMEHLQSRIGSLIVTVKNAFLPAMEGIGGAWEEVVSVFERNREMLVNVVQSLSKGIMYVIDGIRALLGALKSIFYFIADNIIVISTLTACIGAYAAVVNAAAIKTAAFAIVQKTAAAATAIWEGAQWLLNVAMTANPVGLIIAGVVALIAVIAYVCYKTEGWGSLWDGVVGFMKNAFLAYVETIKTVWNTFVAVFLNGIDRIKLAWYDFKKLIGLGDASEYESAISKINSDMQQRQQAVLESGKKSLEYALKAKDALSGIEMSWNSEKSLSDVTKSLKEKLGFGSGFGVNDSLQKAVNGSIAGGGGGSLDKKGAGSKSNEAIATGGARNTTVNIQVGKFFESMIFNGGVRESREQIQREMAEVLSRILGVAETAAS